jgi:predicted DNA-binding antitoxin AbrB/MazE fold protein
LPKNKRAAILTFMTAPKQLSPAGETFHAVFENGALRPLKPLRLKEKSRVLVTVYPELQWRSEFERLRRKMTARTKAISQEVIEAEVTQARAEVKAKRRAARRSA